MFIGYWISSSTKCLFKSLSVFLFDCQHFLTDLFSSIYFLHIILCQLCVAHTHTHTHSQYVVCYFTLRIVSLDEVYFKF